MSDTVVTPAIKLVDRPEDLAAVLATIDEPVVGVDVERADAPRYFRTAALIQIGTATSVMLIDAVAMPRVPAMVSQFLCERTSILHALENDLDPLRVAGVEVDDVVDTGIAASMLGMPIGLDPLLQEVLGVALSPDKSKYQRANWELRPMPQGMVDYAAGDVIHLAELWADLAVRLEERDRRAWYDEELDARIDQAFTDSRAWTRTKGANRLNPARRAVLKALWTERERLARSNDLAPNRVIREDTLVELAEKPADNVRELMARNPRRNRPGRGHAEQLFDAQQLGLDADPIPRPRGTRFGEDERRAFDAVRKARAELADQLGIDSGVLAPSRQLREAVRLRPKTPYALCRGAELLTWQAELLAGPLWEAYNDAFDIDASGSDDDGSSEE